MMRCSAAAVMLVVGLTSPATAQTGGLPAPAPLGAARDLYASARYDEALSVLNTLRGGDGSHRKAVEQYRSLCLLALGRTAEADSAIAAVITVDPTYRPEEAEASPRVRATFAEVRRRLLPEIIVARYQAAKAAYDRKEWMAAEEQFRTVLALIDDPDAGGRVGDLRVLAVGFLELSARAAAPPPPPPVAAAPPGAPEPPPVAIVPPAPPVTADRIYTADDPGVVAPVVVRQEIPSIPAPLIALAKPRGLLDIVVDEQGRVVAMTMRSSVHPTYDALVLAAARDWRYLPARVDGRPVKFRRLISVAVKR